MGITYTTTTTTTGGGGTCCCGPPGSYYSAFPEETVEVACCPGVLLPRALFATFHTTVSGAPPDGCACLDGLAVPLHWDPAFEDPVVGPGIDPGSGPGAWVSDDTFECSVGDEDKTFKIWLFCVGPDIWRMGVTSPQTNGMGGSHVSLLDFISVSCDPFEVDFSDGQNSRFSSAFCANGISVTVTT